MSFTGDEGTNHLKCPSEGLHLDGHLQTKKQLGELSASLSTDGRRRLHIQRECYSPDLDEELGPQQR